MNADMLNRGRKTLSLFFFLFLGGGGRTSPPPPLDPPLNMTMDSDVNFGRMINKEHLIRIGYCEKIKEHMKRHHLYRQYTYIVGKYQFICTKL